MNSTDSLDLIMIKAKKIPLFFLSGFPAETKILFIRFSESISQRSLGEENTLLGYVGEGKT